MLIRSISQKIMLFYIAGIFVSISISSIVLSEIWLIYKKIELQESISNLFEVIQEVRRTEKNFFFYGNEQDYEENLNYIKIVKNIIEKQNFKGLKIEKEFKNLYATLLSYEQMMIDLKEKIHSKEAHLLETKIREKGKTLISIAEYIKNYEQKIIKDNLNKILNYSFLLIGLFFVIPFIWFGLALTKVIIKPLQELETKMQEVAEGKINVIEVKSDYKEIKSLVDTFNKMLKELDNKHKQLIQAEKLSSLGTLLSGIAHELNNPLSNISTSCQILIEELEEADTEYKKELLQAIESQTERAKNIIKTVLEFSRRKDLSKEKINVRNLIEETIILIKGEIPTKVNLILDVEKELFINVDKQRIQQALLNLIKNAIHAAEPEGEVNIKAYLSDQDVLDKILSLRNQGRCIGEFPCNKESVVFEVKDNGAGIPSEIISKIFEPFFTTKEHKGSGLGLFITQELIKEHDGCICVESEVEKGTTFTLILPKE
jgi:signal transduction histidine kinase